MNMELRDHSRRCEHGYTIWHLAVGDLEGCPGGARVVLEQLWDPVDSWLDLSDEQQLVATWEFGSARDGAYIPPLWVEKDV